MTFSTDSRARHTLLLPLFLLVFGFYLLFSPAHFLTTPDEELNLRTTLSLVQGYKGAIPPLPGGFASAPGIDGREYAQYGLGLPLSAAAWVKIGTWVDPSAEVSANDLEQVSSESEAGTRFLRGWSTVFMMLVTALTVLIFYTILLELGFHAAHALFFSLIYAWGTYTFPHGRTFFTEPLVAFCWLAGVACFLQARKHPKTVKWIFYAGLFWAYSVLTRVDSLVSLPAAAWLLLLEEREGRLRLRRHPVEIAAFALPFAVVMLTVALYNQFRFDSFLSTGYEDQAEKIRFVTPLLVGLHGFLFTPGRSIFTYSPILIFFAFGIPSLWRRNAWLCGGGLLLCGLFLGVMSKWQNWSGGYDWGPRHIYQLTPFLMLFAVAFFQGKTLFDSPAKKAGWLLLILISLLVQFLGLAADPVLAIRRMLYAWNDAAIAPGFTFRQVLMQFMVYLPQFSGPVLHWQALQAFGPDLLIVRLAQHSPAWLTVYLLPLGMIGWSGWSIRARLRAGETDSLR
jgi:hypothetical protein